MTLTTKDGQKVSTSTAALQEPSGWGNIPDPEEPIGLASASAHAKAHATASLHAREKMLAELRDSAGRWTRVPGDSQLDEDLKDSQVEIGMYRDQAKNLSDYVKTKMTGAVEALKNGKPDAARVFLADAVHDLRHTDPESRHIGFIRGFNQHILSATTRASARERMAGIGSAEKYPGEFSDKILAFWHGEDNYGAKQALNKAAASWDNNDPDRTVDYLREAARAVLSGDGHNPDSSSRSFAYRELAARIATAQEQATGSTKAVRDFAAKAAPIIPKLLHGGHEEWNGTVSLFDEFDKPSVLADLDWSGHMDMQKGYADDLKEALDHPGDQVRNPDAFTVPLHELIHGVVGGSEADKNKNRASYGMGPMDPERYSDHQQAYQDYTVAQIEEGFTEFGTIRHAPEFFDQMGIGDRPTPFTAGGDNPVYTARKEGMVTAMMSTAARLRQPDFPGPEMEKDHVATRLEHSAEDVRNDMIQGDDEDSVSSAIWLLRHMGQPEGAKLADTLEMKLNTLKATPVGRSKTMSEYATDLQDPVTVDNGDAWGHYASGTRLAQQWVQEIAKAEGFDDLRPGTPGFQRVTQLSDEINREGAAGKIRAMVKQVARINSPAVLDDQNAFGQLVTSSRQLILDDWAAGSDDAARLAFNHAGKQATNAAAALAAEQGR